MNLKKKRKNAHKSQKEARKNGTKSSGHLSLTARVSERERMAEID